MIDQAAHPADGETVAAWLRTELSRADAGSGAVLPVLRHLVAAADGASFSEAVLAHVRAMIVDLAHRLADHAVARMGEGADAPSEIGADAIAHALLDDAAVLAHLHAIALEWQLVEELQARFALDPVTSPLLQAALDGADPADRIAALAFLAAQARWCQSRRRMELQVEEMPSGERAAALRCAGRWTPHDAAGPVRIEAARPVLTASPGGAALDLMQAGLALFLTALARGCGHPRDTVVSWLQAPQALRLVLALLAAGVPHDDAEEQALCLHPAARLPAGLDRITAAQAAELLAARA